MQKDSYGIDNLQYIEVEGEEILLKDEFYKNNYLLFLISGEIEVVYGNLKPRVISEGNMLLLDLLSGYVCKTRQFSEILLLKFSGLMPACDKFVFQSLAPIFTLIKYEFQELEIRPPLKLFLNLLLEYDRLRILNSELISEKLNELIILLRAYYDSEELTMLFYPLLGKNMEFKKMITDNYPKVHSATEYAEICGYSQGVFQRKFKEVFGETVYQWMQRQKAEQIKHRLMVTDVNPKLLAEEFDFASPAHLNKFCKIWFGMTPSELRQTYLLRKNLK